MVVDELIPSKIGPVAVVVVRFDAFQLARGLDTRFLLRRIPYTSIVIHFHSPHHFAWVLPGDLWPMVARHVSIMNVFFTQHFRDIPDYKPGPRMSMLCSRSAINRIGVRGSTDESTLIQLIVRNVGEYSAAQVSPDSEFFWCILNLIL